MIIDKVKNPPLDLRLCDDDVMSGRAEHPEEQADCVWEPEPAAGAGEVRPGGDSQHAASRAD